MPNNSPSPVGYQGLLLSPQQTPRLLCANWRRGGGLEGKPEESSNPSEGFAHTSFIPIRILLVGNMGFHSVISLTLKNSSSSGVDPGIYCASCNDYNSFPLFHSCFLECLLSSLFPKGSLASSQLKWLCGTLSSRILTGSPLLGELENLRENHPWPKTL